MGDRFMYACCNNPVTRKRIKEVCAAAPFTFPWGLKQRIDYEKAGKKLAGMLVEAEPERLTVLTLVPPEYLAAESMGHADPATVDILEQVLVGKIQLQLQAKVVLMCYGTEDTDTGIPLDLRD
jgi:hypothetical protein